MRERIAAVPNRSDKGRPGQAAGQKATLNALAKRLRAVEEKVAQLDSLINNHTGVNERSTILRTWPEIARFLRVSPSSARRWHTRMALPAVRLGRAVVSDKAWLRQWLMVLRQEKARIKDANAASLAEGGKE